MGMSYEQLEQAGYIKKVRFRRRHIRDYLRAAVRDLDTARHNLGKSNDWAFAIAYNAVLQACLALMLLEGYRTVGAEHHKTTFRFARLTLGEEYEAEIEFFDQMRHKRSRVVYGVPGLISRYEAEQALEIATGFVSALKDRIEQELERRL
jgi:uncharacterized protein (UPF0332 family)